jgi:hypothetical protein
MDVSYLVNCFSDGELMGQVLDTPYSPCLATSIEARFHPAGSPFSGPVHVETDRGPVVSDAEPHSQR